MAVTLGNVTTFTDPANASADVNQLISHDHDGAGLLILVALVEGDNAATGYAVSATFDGADVPHLGETEDPPDQRRQDVPRADLLYRRQAPAGMHDVLLTITMGSGTRDAYTVHVISLIGNGPAGVLDVLSAVNASGRRLPLSPSESGGVLIGVGAVQGGKTITEGADYTKIGTDLPTGASSERDLTSAAQVKTITTTGAQDFDMSWSDPDSCCLIGVEIQPDPGHQLVTAAPVLTGSSRALVAISGALSTALPELAGRENPLIRPAAEIPGRFATDQRLAGRFAPDRRLGGRYGIA